MHEIPPTVAHWAGMWDCVPCGEIAMTTSITGHRVTRDVEPEEFCGEFVEI